VSTIAWDIDAEDRLCGFSHSWLSSTPPRERDELAPSRLLGRSMFAMIDDADLRTAYHAIYRHVRQRKQCIRFAYRCDTATERRSYLLQVAPGPAGGLRFATRLLARRQRAPQPGWDHSAGFPPAVWDFCSQCNQVAFPPLGWFELEEISTLALFHSRGMARLRATICPRCLQDLYAYAAA
jgi:hypothetical protein